MSPLLSIVEISYYPYKCESYNILFDCFPFSPNSVIKRTHNHIIEEMVRALFSFTFV